MRNVCNAHMVGRRRVCAGTGSAGDTAWTHTFTDSSSIASPLSSVLNSRASLRFFAASASMLVGAEKRKTVQLTGELVYPRVRGTR